MIIGMQRNHEIYQAAIWVGGEPSIVQLQPDLLDSVPLRYK